MIDNLYMLRNHIVKGDFKGLDDFIDGSNGKLQVYCTEGTHCWQWGRAEETAL